MKKMSSSWIIFIFVCFTLVSWLLFFVLTWGSGNFYPFIPIFILAIQAFLIFLFKQKNLYWFLLFNPVIFLILFNTTRAGLNYIAGKPTLIESSCSEKPSLFDDKESVYIDYFDDDCGDWAGSYYYTLYINNFITEQLIYVFGNTVDYNQDVMK